MRRCLTSHRILVDALKWPASLPYKGLPNSLTFLQWRRRSYVTEVSAAELTFGQPLHETHPHLLEPGELTPGVSAAEYASRRTRLALKLPKGAVAVLAAADLKFKSGDVFYPFRQEANFFYLTGFSEPDAVAVIGKSSDTDHVFHLLVRPKDPKIEAWEGSRSGLDAATDVFNADETGNSFELSTHLPPLLSSATEIYTDISFSKPLSPSGSIFSRFLSSLRSSTKNGSDKDFSSILSSKKVRPLKQLVHDLRAFKSDAEIKLMRKLGRVTGRVFQSIMRRQWSFEHDIMAELEYGFRAGGCEGSAYLPVIAGGKNAIGVHYTRNDDRLNNGDLVLVDAGAEHGHYITDVTRAFPISGTFSPAQRELYEAVLAVQRTCVSLCRQDANVSLDKLHTVATNGLKDNLKGLGFDVSNKTLDILFPHHVGHYIGLDVHDTPGFSRQTPLKERQCITIEPGIRVPIGDDSRFPPAFRGLGIQIEDCVCIGAENPLVLSAEAPKEIADIEALGKERAGVHRVQREMWTGSS